MPSVFSKIVSGDIPAFKVAEDENYVAFLDIFPIAKGHVLVIPKQETDYIFDLDSQEYLGLFSFAKKVAIAMDKVISCERIGVAVIGLEVPHTHIHLIPLNDISDINFERPKFKFQDSEMKEIADLIKSAI